MPKTIKASSGIKGSSAGKGLILGSKPKISSFALKQIKHFAAKKLHVPKDWITVAVAVPAFGKYQILRCVDVSKVKVTLSAKNMGLKGIHAKLGKNQSEVVPQGSIPLTARVLPRRPQFQGLSRYNPYDPVVKARREEKAAFFKQLDQKTFLESHARLSRVLDKLFPETTAI